MENKAEVSASHLVRIVTGSNTFSENVSVTMYFCG